MKIAQRFLATAIGALILMLSASSFAPTSAGATTARPADAFVESIGVNVHLGYADTPYAEDLPTLEERLEELGIHHVRTGFSPGSAEIEQGVRELGGLGIGSTLIMGTPLEPTAALPQMLGEIKSSLLGSVDAVEGPNEWSTSGDPDWKADLIAYLERLYTEVNEDPALAGLPVIGPSIVHNDQAELGDVSSFLDVGNIHSYPEGAAPENKLGYYLQRAALNSGPKPIEATETGYTNATNWTPAGAGENKPISEAAAAVYLPRLFLEYWNHGIARTFSYELVDEYENAALDEREDHFGLLRHDLAPKPAASALENLIALLGDPGPGFTPGNLEYSIGGGTSPVKSVLMEKRDGTFYLALWRLQNIWDPDTKEPIAAAPEALNVSFPAEPVDYQVYEPTVSGAPVASGGRTQNLTVEVGAGVTILKLDPAPVPPPSAAVTAAGATPPVTPGTSVLLLPTWTAPRCVVPALRGAKLTSAKATLRRALCLPRSVAVVTHPKGRAAGVSAPKVTRVEPRAGTVLPAGAPVKLFYQRPARH